MSSPVAPPTVTASSASAPPPARRGLKRLSTADWALVAVTILAVAGTAVFVTTLKSSSAGSTQFQFQIAVGSCSVATHTQSFDQGAQAQFGWSTQSGEPALLTIVGPAGDTVYSLNASYGFGSFTSDGGPYVFEAQSCTPDSVTISGSISAANPD